MTMTQEMEEDRINREEESEEENPYQSMIINDFERININSNTSQMHNGQYL